MKSKAEMMLEQIDKFRKELNDVRAEIDRKINAQDRLVRSEVLILKDYDVKINTLLDLCVKAGVFDKGSFDMISDVRRGLRLLGPDEAIKVGDIVWVSYVAKMPNEEGVLTEISRQEELPVRTGSRTIIFEDQLYDKKVGEKFNFVTPPMVEGPDKGKSFVMEIEILKAKTQLIEVDDANTGIGRDTGADQGQSEPMPLDNGPRHEQRSQGDSQPVLQ